jgi:ubiquinone/menaquinone biosynthesis C-methylase UbiE
MEVEELPRKMQEPLANALVSLYCRDLTKATSARSFSFALKGEFTKSFLADCSHVLNVGCGWGRELVLFKVPVVGVDLDTSALSIAKRFGKDLLVADAHNLPFRDRVFNGVAMTETIEHVKSPMKALLEVHRVLESEGKLALQTPNRRITCLRKTEGHFQEFTKHELSRLVKDCGFYVLRRTGSTIPFIPASRLSEQLRQLQESIAKEREQQQFSNTQQRSSTLQPENSDIQAEIAAIRLRITFPEKVLLLLDDNHPVFWLWKQLNKLLSTRVAWDIILFCRKTSEVSA